MSLFILTRFYIHCDTIFLTQVDEIVITGVLGSCMKVSNALEIGLFPDVEKEKLHFVKNAAGTGAAQLLLNTEIAKEWEKKQKKSIM